ncbi:MAG TPA: phosphoribosylglycinamide formyltransferase [Oscillospiraceae bacterium]|nr:phosphoribosylglycinamide formyltransferase [Oscillospiraceae bacterium]HPF55194.1 phosphoribosylglycinamide formyltransferase [Clostridiales bacterium]HPK36422.1 phosphoribosylglycinamide formyltransferase [Oscillospiraceae bacterium]HPR75726.1 phosphoribosylglycinamide formyltransferase [Oscillospiraceae bacterium]
MKKIAVFASHNGSDLQAVIDGCGNGKIDAAVCCVISNNDDAYALQRAKDAGIDAFCINTSLYPDADELDRVTLEILKNHGTDLILLAGYLKKIGEPVLKAYENRIFNIHPALLPKYGGKGMYGINVHKAVIEANEKFSGVTIHRVNAEYDSGDIVAQATVPVLPSDTPETLAARVLEREHTFLVETLSKIVLEVI